MKVLALLFFFLFAVSSAMAWPPTTGEAEDAGLKLLALQKKGLVQVDVDNKSVAIEPKGWAGFTQKDKGDFAAMALTFLAAMPAKKGQAFVFVRDMASRDVLAVGHLDTGKVEIKK